MYLFFIIRAGIANDDHFVHIEQSTVQLTGKVAGARTTRHANLRETREGTGKLRVKPVLLESQLWVTRDTTPGSRAILIISHQKNIHAFVPYR